MTDREPPVEPRERPLRRSLRERIERLGELLRINAPGTILTREVVLVWKAAWAQYPVEMGHAFAEWEMEAACGSVGVCPMCKGSMPHEIHVCQSCLDHEDELGEQGF